MLNLQKFIIDNPIDWEDKLKHDPYNLTIKHDQGYVIFSYNQYNSDFSNPVVQEARGVILRESDYSVACMAFTKFFNYGEPNAAEIDWSTARVQTKVDGSIMKLWFDNGKWHLSTNSMIDADYVLATSPYASEVTKLKTFGQLFREIAQEIGLDFDKLNRGYTYVFELTTVYNRQVIAYEKPMIWHIGTRDMNTMEELREHIDCPGLPTPKEWPMTNLTECVDIANNFTTEQEGFVVVDANWRRIKVKSPYHVASSHALNDEVGLSKLIALFLSGDYDEFLSYFPKYSGVIGDMEKYMADYIDRLNNQWAEYEKIDNLYEMSRYEFYKVVETNPDRDYFINKRMGSDMTARDYIYTRPNVFQKIKNYLRGNEND